MNITMQRAYAGSGLRLVFLVALLLTATIVAGLLIAGRERPLPPPIGPAAAGLLAFESEGDIVAASLDGSGRRTISGTDDVEFGPAWSHDGTRLAFWSMAEDSTVRVMVVDADGANRVEIGRDLDLKPDSRRWPPVWSPDGRVLLLATASGDLYRVNADGTGARRIGSDDIRHFYPAWSPDGARIAFLDGSQTEGYISVMDADGGHVTRVSAQSGGGPAWSPDGRQLAYWTPDQPGDLYVATFDGSRWTENLVRGGPTDDVAPSWSNDGTRLAFLRLQGNVGEILVMPATGGDARVVADVSEGASFARICWTPDDQFVVAAARGKERSFVITPTDGTGSPKQIQSTGSLSADTCTVQRLAQ